MAEGYEPSEVLLLQRAVLNISRTNNGAILYVDRRSPWNDAPNVEVGSVSFVIITIVISSAQKNAKSYG